MSNKRVYGLLGFLVLIVLLVANPAIFQVSAATVLPPQNPLVPPMAYDDGSITIVWQKPADYSNVAGYNIYQNQSLIGTTTKLFYTLTGLAPNTSYTLTVRAKDSSGIESVDSPAVVKTTMPTQTVYNVTTYGAVGNGTILNTAAIQQAIDACSAGGKVLIPSGTFKSGALFLKSNMTLQIDGTLLGSDNAADYPLTSMRFTYYTCKNYMGLINAYTTNYGSITNVRIFGSGNIKGSADTSSITGHGITTLGKAQASAGGNDSARADMITMKGVTNLYIGGLNMTYPAEHTIFISFCKNVTINGINASTYDIHNADGVDLATTDTAYIFNSTFDTGDDCINFNAGCGATGVSENYPDQNIRVFNCTCKRGHGAVVFGSFTAAWIKNVNVEDCAFDGTDIGLRFKTGNDQGGGADNVYARDLTIKNIQDQALFWDSSYDSAYSGGGKGQFKNIYVDNVTVTTSKSEGIYIHGQSGMPHNNINISNVTLSGTGGASLDYCINSTFSNITFVSGSSSTWSISNSSGLSFVNCNPRPAGYSNSTPTPTRTNTPTPTSRQGSTPTRRVAGTAIPTRTTSPTAMVTPTPTARPVTPTPTSRRTSTATPTRRAVVTATPNNRAGTPTSRLSSTPTSTPPSGTTLFSDNFESGNANNWTATTGTWSVVQDSGSYVYYQSSANEGRTSAGSSSWTNYAVEAKVKVDNFNGANRAYVCGRYRDGNNFYCASLYNSSGGTLEIRKKVAGSTTNLVTKTNVGLVAGTWYTVKLVLNGSNISVYLNGIQVLTATDSSLTSGAVGLIAYKVVAKYDDVVVSGL